MDDRGFIKLAIWLLQELHDVRVEQAAICGLLSKQKLITQDQLETVRQGIADSPPSRERRAVIQKLAQLDLETFLRDFEGPIQ